MSQSEDYWYTSERAREADALWRAHSQRQSNALGTSLIEGIYHPHLVDGPGTFPIVARTETLGQTYLTAVAGFLAEVSMPRLDLAHKSSGPLAPPKFDSYSDDFDWSKAQFRSEPDWPKWGRNNGSGRVTIRDFRIAVDPGDASSAEAAQAVHDAIGGWWRTVKSWIELLTSQDLEGADRFHWSSGSLHLRYRDHANAAWRSQVGRSSLRNSWRPDMGFGVRGQLASAFHAAGCDHSPPREWQLLREALRAFEVGQYRRVLVEVGIAAEIALTAYLTRADRMPARQKPTLGPLVSAEEAAGRENIIPSGFRDFVLEVRNQVVHQQRTPTDHEAVLAFERTVELLEAASPRDRLIEPYGLVLRTDPPADSRS